MEQSTYENDGGQLTPLASRAFPWASSSSMGEEEEQENNEEPGSADAMSEEEREWVQRIYMNCHPKNCSI